MKVGDKISYKIIGEYTNDGIVVEVNDETCVVMIDGYYPRYRKIKIETNDSKGDRV